MSEKSFTVIFIAITIVAVIGIIATRLINSNSSTPLPSASQPQPTQPVEEATQAATNTMTKKTYSQAPAPMAAKDLKSKKAVIQTTKGVIEFEIYPEATQAASNFIFLADDKFYDGLTFHRVVPGFVIQGGDPLGNGTGGPGYRFADEPVKRKYDKGIVAMANSGPDTNGSQFFIMLEDNPGLPPNYTIFGKVTKGQDVVSKIAVGDTMETVSIMPLK
ncbi:MAG TPA: peptidylprolyl isomerase [Patescibacteria group bacterium]|nr:peptidylprolyl isomerase [Patescibacteria group bacterium]